MRLITIPVSHYCEKARWALDRAGVDYREEQHLQILHRPHVRAAGAGNTTPALVTDDGVYPESHDILELVDSKLPSEHKLYPDTMKDDVIALERRFDEPYGVETRKLFYEQMSGVPKAFMMRANNHRAPRWEKAVFSLTLPLAKAFLFHYLDINERSLVRARETVRETIDDVAERLSDGRPFLCGDTFTAADLTFAALSAPLAIPEDYGVPIPRRSELPESVLRFLEPYDDHPAVQFARRMYATERRRVVRA